VSRHSIAVVCALTALVSCASPESKTAARLIEQARAGDGGWRKLAYLCDRIGPRLSGSAQLEQAVGWTAEEMARDGADRVWTERVMVPHWVRGIEKASIETPTAQPLAVAALGGSIGTPPGGIRAEVIEVDSIDALKREGAKVAGRIVLYNRIMRCNGKRGEDYGAASPLRTTGAIEAAKLGAVATLVRSLGTADYRLVHTGAMRYEEGTPKIPAAAIAAEDAMLIHRLLESEGSVTVRLELGCGTLPEAESANVLAEVQGRAAPGEVVLIGAHLDSWDLGTGAIDDGAGVVIVMESLRLLKTMEPRPRRTIRAVLFTNEENGLRGGRGYAAAHKDEWPLHVAAIESDSGAGRPQGFSLSAGRGGEEMARGFGGLLAGIGAGRIWQGGGGADIGPLSEGGVPLLGLRQDSTYYFDYHHSPADTLDKVDPEGLRLNVAAMSVMAWMLADTPIPLPRTDPSQPRPRRQR